MCCDTKRRRSDEATTRGRRHRTGFSLVELMVVLVIIALLASFVGYNVAGYMDRARQNKARADLSLLAGAVRSYYADHGRYPTTSQWPDAIVPDYIEQLPKDPWGNDYQYEFPGRQGPFDVICFGADGREGGEGSDRDITNWDLNNVERDAP